MRKPSPLRTPLLCLLGLLCAGLVAVSPAAASSLPTVTVTDTSSAATITGALESGAVNVVSTATGVKEGQVIFFKLGAGVTIAEVEAFTKNKKEQSDPNNSVTLGAIVFDAEADTETNTILAPGQYALLTSEGEKPVAVRASFTVAESKAPLAMPAPGATERSIDFGFRGPSTLKDGELVAFENEGFVVHMDIAFPVKSMKVAKKVVAQLKSGHEKGLEKEIAGAPVSFAGPLSHDAMQESVITAKPGIYVQVCFMATQDGRVHTLLGMERIIKIVK